MSDEEQWKLKYLDTIRQLEAETEQCRELEAALRRLGHHLCLTARGYNPSLDGVLEELAGSLKFERKTDVARLEQFIARMQMAVREPGRAPSTPPAQQDDNATARELVGAMSKLLPPVPGLGDELERVQESLGDNPQPDWAKLLSGVADVLREQCLRAQRERRELESFLKEVTNRLGEFNAFLTGHEESIDNARGEGALLESRIRDEVQGLHAGMAGAETLEDLRDLVGMRLDAISHHVRGFREAEERRCLDHKIRADRLRQRIVQMEHETQALRRIMEDERALALIDQLTGIPNRQAFDDRMHQEFNRWKRFGTPLSLLVWDVDNFKAINDSYGHKAGDKVIRAVGQALIKRVRETDFAARYGGEEFVMLLSGAAGHEALGVAEQIRREIESMGFHFRGDRVPITISAGIATFGEGDTPESVFDNADRALYEAKNTGRNRCVLH